MKNMKKFIVFFALCLPFVALADEGMWLINSFGNAYPQMKKEGLKLTPSQIYSETGPSVAGAIVAVDGGHGTGSMVSAQGLMITNHHVAYSDIHALSTPEKNYLEEGFWALDRKDEIPIKGKTVTFVRKVVDVTAEGKALYDSLKQAGRLGPFTSRRIFSIIQDRHAKAENTPYDLSCSSFFRGELYLLFYEETYKDVRLVGAPPVSMGAFGGETDNWGWPQHKCDFALYRVYAGKDGRPAEYSPDNAPMKPVKYLNIATSGVHDGEYAMIIGFPGRTSRYSSSFAVEQKETIINPIAVKSRRDMLNVMLAHMEADPKVRLLYADKYFGISNYTDYAKWENICLRRYDVVGIKAREEAAMQQWIDSSPQRKQDYGTMLPDLKKGYAAMADANRERTYFQEDWFRAGEISATAGRLASVAANMERKNVKTVVWGDESMSNLIMNIPRLYTKGDVATERDCFLKLAPRFVANVPASMRGKGMNDMLARFDGDAEAMFAWAVDNSIIRSEKTLKEFFSTPRTREEILADPMATLAVSVSSSTFVGKINQVEKSLGYDPDSLETVYGRVLYFMRKDKGIPQYPDANGTIRMTYGTVGPLSALDAIHYDSRSTIAGYMQKYDPDNYEFRVDDKLQGLIKAGDWGRWGEKGVLYANFLTNNDITGGNSGSPVLNANGDIIGLAFDGNRESMSGGLYFHPEYFKTVNVDIRFVLWTMDKYAGAGKLIDEMTLVK